MEYKLIKEVKYKKDIYRLRLKQTTYRGLSMWFENNDGNYLFETFRDKDNLNYLLKAWHEILNNKEVEIFY